MMFVGHSSDNILVPTGQNGTHPMQLIPASAVGNIDSQVAHDPGWHGRHTVASYLAMKILSAVDVFYFWIDHRSCFYGLASSFYHLQRTQKILGQAFRVIITPLTLKLIC